MHSLMCIHLPGKQKQGLNHLHSGYYHVKLYRQSIRTVYFHFFSIGKDMFERH